MSYKIKTPDLNKREYGSLFAPFESELIFKRNEHIGWVVHTGINTFKLKYSPFFGHFRKDPKYLVDITYVVSDPKLMPPEGECVQVEGKLMRKPVRVGKFFRYEIYCHVENYSKFNVSIPKPDINHKDFLYYCSFLWDFADDDDLDDLIALQLISCPNSLYGRGGFGGITAKLTKRGVFGRKYISNIKKTFRILLPSEFTKSKSDPKYLFKFITNPKPEPARVLSPTTEVNYTTACATGEQVRGMSTVLPYQLPILVRHAEYNREKEKLFEPYLLIQYQLSALMHNPSYDDKHINLLRRNIKEIQRTWNVEDLVKIDLHTANRLALGLCRLHLEPTFKEKRVREAIRFIKNQQKDWEDYSKMVENVSSFRRRLPLSIQDNLTKTEIQILVALKRIHDEMGFDWVESRYLKSKYFSKMPYHEFLNHLMNLSNATLIIQKNNFGFVRLTFEEIYPDND